jgi:hypothetical protein
LTAGKQIVATINGSDGPIRLRRNLSERKIEILMAGGAINWHDGFVPNSANAAAEPNAPEQVRHS